MVSERKPYSHSNVDGAAIPLITWTFNLDSKVIPSKIPAVKTYDSEINRIDVRQGGKAH
jgi:hypothetical protein